MRESWISISTVYMPMFGVPILLLIYAFVYSTNLILLKQVLLGLSMFGLLVFGLSGVKDVYIRRFPKNAITLKKSILNNESQGPENTPAHSGKFAEFNVFRFDPKTQELKESKYTVGITEFSTVLDGLLSIKTKNDPSLSMRYSCRMGICGSCGMVINGKPSLACETNVTENLKDGKIEVSPMLGHPLLKDLVTDFDDFFEKHVAVSPYLFRKDLGEKYHPTKEYPQTKLELDKFLPFSYCIMCGLCVDACPVVNTNPEFIGPQALSQAYRYYADSRDEGGEIRLKQVDTLKGVWDCEYSGSCSEVCPKGVDPAFAIQLLKKEIVKDSITAHKN
ncbi:MAG: succinate dehydrogenase iron-sulfur subunit [Candidatus Parvarchaeota archaeon]|nr:succinate dehydrogenase iron-sulfur subunit [Candidatus Parvarchaeota archaeon]MCL5101530.1 succinate dehydrogenase iron-sulfur subunit [Candidatus Parvarchaeota archaeon]